jgi:hypothetical protein
VIIQASNIFTKLSAEGVEAANRYAATTRALAGAIRDPATRPRRVSELELETEQLRVIHERKNRIIEDFDDFLGQANAAYKEKDGGTEQG